MSSSYTYPTTSSNRIGSSQRGGRRAPWENNERHYCALCNAWMGSDRISISIHENGKKHREKAEEDVARRRADKVQRERDEAKRLDLLRSIEEEAIKSHAADVGVVGMFASSSSSSFTPAVAAVTSSHSRPPTTSTVPSYTNVLSSTAAAQAPPRDPKLAALPAPEGAAGIGGGGVQLSSSSRGGELSAWLARKRKREEERSPSSYHEVSEGTLHASETTTTTTTKPNHKKMELGKDEGHYSVGDVTYLEGPVYASSVLSEDVPVQIWTGSWEASDSEKRSIHGQRHWKSGLVVKIIKESLQSPSLAAEGKGEGRVVDSDANANVEPLPSAEKMETTTTTTTFDVAYLRDPSDDDETLERRVRSDRLRIVLGSDDALPGTIEEARLELMGGVEVVDTKKEGAASLLSRDAGAGADTTTTTTTTTMIDENTGLSSWNTVSVRRVAASRTVKEERAREKSARIEEAIRARDKEKEAKGRRMEEVRHANADDSALGSYDVWSGGKGGYKGVDIHGGDAKVDVEETARSLSRGEVAVQFKAAKQKAGGKDSAFMKGRRKQNRRVTSADDDD